MARDPITQLEHEAAEVLELLRSADRVRPFFIEFSGTPKAGKTTIINSLRLFLNRNGYRISVLAERASTSPIVDKLSIDFNVWTSSQTLSQMLVEAQWPEIADVVIVDRGLFDSLAWMDWMLKRGATTDEIVTKVVEFLMIGAWRELIDLVFVMLTTPDQSLHREYKDQVTQKPGRIMNADAIDSFNQSLERTKERYSHLFTQVVEVRTMNDIEPQETGRVAVKTALDAMRRILSP